MVRSGAAAAMIGAGTRFLPASHGRIRFPPTGESETPMTQMQAARMHGYKEPLRIEEVPVPEPGPEEILLKVAATGMCRSDYQQLEGYFEGPFPVDLPFIPGHEVTGRVAGLGSAVPTTVGYSEGDMVVVNPSWGDGTSPAVPRRQRTAVQRQRPVGGLRSSRRFRRIHGRGVPPCDPGIGGGREDT